MSFYGDTVLDAALAVGIDAPYSCKNGMCSTCRARVTSGTAAMDVNYSLSEKEAGPGLRADVPGPTHHARCNGGF